MCPSATNAPNNDLNLIKDIIRYKAINESIANAALSSFKNHLWYISEILVDFSFFDSDIDISTKKKMVKNVSRDGSKCPLNRIKIDHIDDMDEIGNRNIEDFVFSSTLTFLKILKLETQFLKINPKYWNDNPEYINAKIIVQNLKVRKIKKYIL